MGAAHDELGGGGNGFGKLHASPGFGEGCSHQTSFTEGFDEAVHTGMDFDLTIDQFRLLPIGFLVGGLHDLFGEVTGNVQRESVCFPVVSLEIIELLELFHL